MTRMTKIGLLSGAAALAAGAAMAGEGAMKYSYDRATDDATQTSLGVTVGQIDDADLIGRDGSEIGEVEAVLTGANGEPHSVLIELERDWRDVENYGERDRYVELALSELSTVEDDDFINLWDERIDLVTQQSAEDIAAMERWSYDRNLAEMEEKPMDGHGARMELSEADKERLRGEVVTDRSQQTSLGVNVGQIDDADVINTDGEELGEVEAVLKNAAGEPDRVLVELESGLFERDRLVEIDLNEFETRSDDDFLNLWDDEIDLVTSQPLTYFEEMPDWQYTTERSDRASLQ